MATPLNRLSARAIIALTKTGRHADGGNLYLNIAKNGSKSWVFMYRWQGKIKEMGLGGYPALSLLEARRLAEQYRKALAQKINPMDARATPQPVAAAPVHTFNDCCELLMADIMPTFRNDKHKQQWRSTIATYAAPILNKPVADIDTQDVLAVLRPIWQTKAETAARVRGRIERVIDAAKANGWRDAENPARWHGHLDKLLPKRLRLTRGHMAALPYQDVPALIAQLHGQDNFSALALMFCILTAARTSEVLLLQAHELDMPQALWTLPAQRMKAGREHRVPLSTLAVAVLQRAQSLSQTENAYVFQGIQRGKPLSNMAMMMLLRRMQHTNITVHGFRSAFRDWVAEETSFAREVAEAALAHTVGDTTERAYRRGDALEKRRVMMQAWADFCGGMI